MPYRELDTTGYREKLEELEKQNEHYRSLLRGDRIKLFKKAVRNALECVTVVLMFLAVCGAALALLAGLLYAADQTKRTNYCEKSCGDAGQIFFDREGDMCTCIDSSLDVKALPDWDFDDTSTQ